MLSFGQRLRLLRKEASYTQNELAEKLLVSVQSVSKWECDNTMPDVSQIVPLAAVLGVTTDCLLGVGTDEKADRKKLIEDCNRAWEKNNSNSYDNNACYICYELCKDYMKKYPLDYGIKYACAEQIYSFLENSASGDRYSIPEEEEKTLHAEALKLSFAVMNYDKDPLRLMEARELLIALYLYKKDYEKAVLVAEELPNKYNIRERQLLEIHAKQKDFEKALESANKIVEEETELYLRSLFVKGRRISVFGNARKEEAIAAWHELLDAARFNHRISGGQLAWDWILNALTMLSNDYIAISEFDKAFEKMNECAEWYAKYAAWLIEITKPEERDKLNIMTAEMCLAHCYNWCFPTDDNIITRDPRYKECLDKLSREMSKILN